MSNSSPFHGKPSLKKVLGVSSLFAAAMGSVSSQSSFVSLLNGVGTGGLSFFIALFLAFILTLCYVFSYLELSLMMPKAGGPGTYATVALGQFPAIIVVLGGYLAVSAFTGPSELMLLERVLDTIFPGAFGHIGLILLAVLTLLNILGINIFSSIQNTIVFIFLVAVLVIGFAGLNNDGAKGISNEDFWHEFSKINGSVFSLTMLALWSFAGLEFACPLLEEAKRPEKNLPKAMLMASVMLLVVYSLFSFAALRQVPAADLRNSEIPHWLLVSSIFGKAGNYIMVIFAITTCSCTLNAIIAGVPRLLYGMAHNHQLPTVFKMIHRRWGTPWFGILFQSLLIAIPLILLSKQAGFILTMVISALTLWLMAYIIAHINVMVLRKKYPRFHRPFKTPLYPIPQCIGIVGMGYAIWNNSPSPDLAYKVYLNTAIIITIIGLFAFFWVKFRMKKKLFNAESIEKVMAD